MNKTKTKGTYASKLKDPRWQRKRLEVMEYNSFECEVCGDKESTLNVHHKAYKKNAEPWEYEEHELSCLCDGCHAEAHHMMAMVDAELFRFRTDPNFGDARLLGYLQGVMSDGPFPVSCLSYEYAEGMVDAWSRYLYGMNRSPSLADIIIDLATHSKNKGEAGHVWFDEYRWHAAQDVVLKEMQELLDSDPHRLVRRCEGYAGMPPPVPMDVSISFINAAKHALDDATRKFPEIPGNSNQPCEG